MQIVVHKYGGTSVGSLELIQNVANNIAVARSRGYKLIVVVSAMSGETNRLLELARSINPSIALNDRREIDAIAATGEQVTIALLSLALKKLHIPAKSYCGWQLPIITTPEFSQARIKHIAKDKVLHDLRQGTVVIVAGFQGVNEAGDITTFGRGGSDTSAVALAVSFNAHECQIYTDVNGIYNADPNKITSARRLETISGTIMLEAASLGAKVLHVRSCELAYRYKTNLRVLSTFAPQDQGTLVMNQHDELTKSQDLEQYPIVNLSVEEDKTLVTFELANGAIGTILGKVYARFNLDMLHINGQTVAFVIDEIAAKELEQLLKELNVLNLHLTHNLNKLSLIGSGFRSNNKLNQSVWKLLENTEIFATAHNEISISILVHQWDSATVRNKLAKLI
jgi:aspartate kinase